MIVYFVATAIFWLNAFTLSKPDTGLPNTKGPGQLILGTVIYYKKFFHLQPSKYVQVNQEDEPRITINIDSKSWSNCSRIPIQPPGRRFLKIILIGKRL